MVRSFPSAVALALSLFWMPACRPSTAEGVPSLDASLWRSPTLEGLEPREIRITVEDVRRPPLETSTQVVAELDRALRARFEAIGFRVHPKAPSHFAVVLAVPDRVPSGYEQTDCVELRGDLVFPTGSLRGGRGTACSFLRNGYGMNLGGQSTEAYDSAMDSLLKAVEDGWRQLRAR